MNQKNKKVFVALSGGVDSAVAAALLKERGHDVIGVFIKIWQPEFLECTWREDRLDAMRVAAALEIPFKEVDLSDVYKKEVIDEMLVAYKRGITPNPDVLCNRYIKFGALWEWAKMRGADYIATGHHARIKKVYTRVYTEVYTFELQRGVDAEKDQSYFLWQLTQEDLVHTLMPVGTMKKDTVRAYAKKYNLPVAEKPDSQGLCFVGDIDMRQFLQRYIEVKKGAVRDESGAVVGEHDGAVQYTIGQRHGFRIQTPSEKRQPRYVADINVAENVITVTSQKDKIAVNEVELEKENWLQKTRESDGFLCMVRYRQKPQVCRLDRDEKKTRVHFDIPQIVAPGQSLVIYNGDTCVGGGIIRNIE